MREQLKGINLEKMADIRQSRKKRVLVTFSSLALFLLFVYSLVNYAQDKPAIAGTNFVGALFCALHLIYLLKSKKPSFSALIPSCTVLANAFINIADPQGTIFWVYPILAAILTVNEFRASLIYTAVFFLGTGVLLNLGGDSSINYFTYQNLSTDKFLLSAMTLALVTLISNYSYKNASDYLQSLYQEGIDQLAYRDRLTGLANRWSFEVWAKQKLTLADQQNSVTALLFLDIDNFKAVNDNHGHFVGDELLQLFAKRLENNMRTKDRKTDRDDYSIARYAGDEFMILLHDIPSIQDVERIVERINLLFHKEIQQSEFAAYLTFSIGISVYKQDAQNLEDLIRCADKAMYEAKNSGKDRYCFYHTSHNAPASEKIAKLNIVQS